MKWDYSSGKILLSLKGLARTERLKRGMKTKYEIKRIDMPTRLSTDGTIII